MNAINEGGNSGEAPEGGRWVDPETVRQNVLRAQEAIERARTICAASWIERMKARGEREMARRLRSPEAALPDLEYALPPLATALVYLARGLPPLPETAAARDAEAGSRQAAFTVLYAWGYGRSRSRIVRMQFRETEAACRFAAERGWDRRRPGAWAGEQLFCVGLRAALRAVEPSLRVEPSVAGWGGKLVRAD